MVTPPAERAQSQSLLQLDSAANKWHVRGFKQGDVVLDKDLQMNQSVEIKDCKCAISHPTAHNCSGIPRYR